LLAKVCSASTSFPAAQCIVAANPEFARRSFLQPDRQPKGNSALCSVALCVLVFDAAQRPHAVGRLRANQPHLSVRVFHQRLNSPVYLRVVSQLSVLQASYTVSGSNPKTAVARRKN